MNIEKLYLEVKMLNISVLLIFKLYIFLNLRRFMNFTNTALQFSTLNHLSSQLCESNQYRLPSKVTKTVVQFNSSSAAVCTGLLWLDNTSTSLYVRFKSNSIHHQLRYALGSFGLTTQAQASMYASNLIQFIISCGTHWVPLA